MSESNSFSEGAEAGSACCGWGGGEVGEAEGGEVAVRGAGDVAVGGGGGVAAAAGGEVAVASGSVSEPQAATSASRTKTAIKIYVCGCLDARLGRAMSPLPATARNKPPQNILCAAKMPLGYQLTLGSDS